MSINSYRQEVKALISEEKSEDLSSHDWQLMAFTKNEMILKCNKCKYLYSITIFDGGAVVKKFMKVANGSSIKLMSCDACEMDKALK